ncbi:MAG TPA: cysteine--tRNA ligase [Actinomycetes bacterium]|nr:cysteine--tRNA ligase [Actinomycetes bacterium]
MSLRLYDTAAREVRDFVPLVPGKVGVYVCGLTVQSDPHLGHVRSAVAFDVLRRWLAHSGFDVTYIRNVTDIDDKILLKSAEEGREWWEHAFRYERAVTWAYDALGCLPPTYEPRATGHVPEMLEIIETLLERGHAYVAADGSGDVYFDVRSWPAYGELTHQRVDDMEPAADADPRGKRDPRDFALWKGRKPEEPATASWPTPWGPGRPGWHVECSAMAGKYLGAEFDIHGGGIDLRFPHHENEQAQSRAAGQPFARYWMHNAWLTTAGEKMSKSLGNSLLVPEVLRRFRAVEVRWYMVSAHYRSNVEYSDEAVAEAATAYRRVEGFVERAVELVGHVEPAAQVPDAFAAHLDDDLSVPAALAVLHETLRAGNAALAEGGVDGVRTALADVRAMTAVLGVDPLDPRWAVASDERLRATVDALVAVALEQREAARDRKDYAGADAIRDALKASGVVVEDTAAGPRWTLQGGS